MQACLAAVVAQAREGEKLRHECRMSHLPLWPISGKRPFTSDFTHPLISMLQANCLPLHR